MSTNMLLRDRLMTTLSVLTLLLIFFVLGLSSVAGSERVIKTYPDYDDIGWQLGVAAEEGNLTRVKKLIGMGVDINFYEGMPLSVASEQGHTEVVRFLLESGANPNGTNDDDISRGRPLKNAAENNHLEILDLLLDAGVILEPSRFGETALGLAVENGHLEAVKKLLKAGSDPRRSHSYYLVSAAYRGHLEILKTLLAAGSKVSDRPDSIIDESAGKGNVEIIKVIVETGLEPEYLDIGLKRAAGRGHLDAVKYLLEQGANTNAKGALSDAATYGFLDTVKYLLEKGANITCDGDDSSCPWHNAAKNGHADVIALLVDYGIDINAPLEEDLTWYDGVKYGRGWTVMHFAAQNGYPIAKELMELGADINVQDARGQTPLQLAVKEEKFMSAKELLKICADLTPRDETGKSALDFATEISVRNATEVTYMFLVTALEDQLQEKIDTSANNYRTARALIDEFKALVEADAKLTEDIGEFVRFPVFASQALSFIFEQRARGKMIRILEDHKCKEFAHTFSVAPVGTEYWAKCDCIPGQGPMMTISPMQQQQQPATIQCGSTESPIQEVTSTEFAMLENSTDVPVEIMSRMEIADN